MSDEIREATIEEIRTFFRWVNDNCLRVPSRMLSSTRFEASNKCFAGERDGRIIAAAVFSMKDSKWELATVYVAKQYRRSGLALRLAQTGLRSLIDEGITPIRSQPTSQDGARLLNRLKREFGENLVVEDDGYYESLPEKSDPPEPPAR